MKPSVIYRTASVLIFLFAVGHTLGFEQADPKWGVGTLLGLMKSVQFLAQGFA